MSNWSSLYSNNKREEMQRALFELVEEYQSESKEENRHKYDAIYTAKREYFYKIFELFAKNIDQVSMLAEIQKRRLAEIQKRCNDKDLFTPTLGSVYWWRMPDGGMCLGKATPILIAQGGCVREASDEEKKLFKH